MICSPGTADFYKANGLDISMMHKPSSGQLPSVVDALEAKEIDLVINIRDSKADDGSVTDGYLIRRKAVDFKVCLLTDVKLAALVIHAMWRLHNGKAPPMKAWDEFGSS